MTSYRIAYHFPKPNTLPPGSRFVYPVRAENYYAAILQAVADLVREPL